MLPTFFHPFSREMLDQLQLMANVHSLMNPLDTFPLLAKFHQDFAALPGNARYFSSKLSKLPMNAMIASIGAEPDTHGPWKVGQKMEWGGLTGLYY
jgi:hypothetical protein